MNKEQQILPELRFPEFVNDGFWVYKKLGDYEELSSGDGDWILSKNINTDGEYQIVQLSSIGFGNFKEKELKTISKETFNELKGTPILKGDLLINRMVDSDKINNCIFPHKGDYVTSVDVCWIRENSLINNYFLMNLLCTNGSQIKLLSLSSGAGRVRISKRNLFERFVFAVPSNPNEQQKIANCLSSLDEVINAETEKLELLQDHKKGLLQQLFPQEGETQPKYRFPEYRNDGDWKETTLDAVADYENGKAHEKEISKTGKYKVVNSKFISTEGEVVKFSDSVNLETKIGDILMVLSDIPNGKALSKCFYVDKNDTYTVNQRICKITSTNINSVFLFYQLNRNKYFLRFDDGNKQTNLRKDDVLNCPILKPTNPKEQDKIANTLTSASTLIEEQQEKIRRLQAHKKGLLQQLFPNLNDVAV